MPYLGTTKRKRPWRRQRIRRNSYARSEFDKFYNSKGWRILSRQERSKNRRCCNCNKLYPDISNLVLDHIIPISLGGSKYDRRNHEVLCHSCHNKKSGKEAHGVVESFTENNKGELIPRRNA